MPETLIGSPKQVAWAERIMSEIAGRGWPLPDVGDARFWIDHAQKCAGALDLVAEAQRYLAESMAAWDSPFTEDYPRFTREEARQALDGLRRLAASPGVIVLDLETSGLEKADRIVEIAAVRWPSRQVVIDTVVQPPAGRWPHSVSEITAEELAAAPIFEGIAEGVARWAEGYHLSSWNTRFDMRVLLLERRLSGWTPRLRATCAMRLAGAWLQLDDWPSLEEAAEMLGVQRAGDAHRAMPDVLTTCAVLDAMAGEGGS